MIRTYYGQNMRRTTKHPRKTPPDVVDLIVTLYFNGVKVSEIVKELSLKNITVWRTTVVKILLPYEKT